MAMNKDKGYCPNDAFGQRVKQKKNLSPYWEETMELLGDRKSYMVYPKDGNTLFGEGYIVDALLGATGTLGIQIASALKQLIPTCISAKKGCPIVCTDIINPNQLLSKARQEKGRWTCIGTERKACSGQEAASFYEDERYCVIVQEGEGEVRIYLYRK